MTNPLKKVRGKWRRIGYITLATVGISITGAIAGFGAIEQDIPNWLKFAAAFYGTVTGPVWAMPASNVQRSEL